MRRVAVILILLVFSIATSPSSLQASSRVEEDSLLRVYSKLRVGLKLSEVRDLVEKYCSDCQLRDTSIWDEFSTYQADQHPLFSFVFGIDSKPIGAPAKNGLAPRLSRIVLRVDFDGNAKLMNAVYVRLNKRDFKEVKSGAEKFAVRDDERKVLVGTGYYK